MGCSAASRRFLSLRGLVARHSPTVRVTRRDSVLLTTRGRCVQVWFWDGCMRTGYTAARLQPAAVGSRDSVAALPHVSYRCSSPPPTIAGSLIACRYTSLRGSCYTLSVLLPARAMRLDRGTHHQHIVLTGTVHACCRSRRAASFTTAYLNDTLPAAVRNCVSRYARLRSPQ